MKHLLLKLQEDVHYKDAKTHMLRNVIKELQWSEEMALVAIDRLHEDKAELRSSVQVSSLQAMTTPTSFATVLNLVEVTVTVAVAGMHQLYTKCPMIKKTSMWPISSMPATPGCMCSSSLVISCPLSGRDQPAYHTWGMTTPFAYSKVRKYK